MRLGDRDFPKGAIHNSPDCAPRYAVYADRMERTLLKALVVLDDRENSWFLHGAFHEAIDFRLMEVEALRVKMQNLQWTVRQIAERAPDVLLLDSTLSSHFVLRTAIYVRDKMPNLPILLLPDIRGASNHQSAEDDAVPVAADTLPVAADAALIAADTIAQTIRYTHGRLGLQRTLLQMALRDDLTGLHNRRGFIALATQQLAWARDAGQHMVMFFADLDGLKWINDHFGHDEGDRAISLTAACVRETFRKFDVTARLSGDEFVALIMEEPGRSAETICRRLQMNLTDCVGADSPYKLSLSVGVAHFDPAEPATLQELMKEADTGLYQHKRRKRSPVSGGVAAAAPSNGHRRSARLKLNPSLPRG
jgi:two-component system cell cycle response regulator